MTATDAPPAYPDALPSYEGAQEMRLAVTADAATNEVLVTLTPPREPASEEKKGFKRAPVDICCVIDVSGSMGTAATIPGEEGKEAEVTNLSILDVVKHAMRTIMATMKADDRIAIVPFHSSAWVEAPLTFMDDAGKKKVDKIIEDMRPLSSTNLWDGLKVAMNLLNGEPTDTADPETTPKSKAKGSRFSLGKKQEKKAEASSSKAADGARVSAIFCLTDGQPNVEPPRGHIPMLQSYLDANPKSSFSINTFGFGYSLDSALLLRIAELGGGHYGFIPDSGMVGTVFVHAVANILATCAVRCVLDVEVEGDVTVLGDLAATKTSWGSKIDIGDVQYGQSQDVVLRLPGPAANIAVTARYVPWAEEKQCSTTVSGVAAPETADLKYHMHRLELVRTLHAATGFEADGKMGPDSVPTEIIDTLTAQATTIENDPTLSGFAPAQALASDIRGQILLALTNATYFSKWGRHYLPSLARAHQRQRCGNFKDAGLQVYGANSPLFAQARDALDAAFDALPPPKPSNPHRGGRSVSKMSVWNNSAGPCVHGASKVQLLDGAVVRVDELRRGMVLAGGRAVGAVLRTATRSGVAELCALAGGQLYVTPWHPVQLDGEWVFPVSVAEAHSTLCDAVYSVLLAPGAGEPVLEIGGVPVITLGHGKDGGVLAHAFLGSYERVVAALAAMPGFDAEGGVVECAGVVRGMDGRISGFVPASHEDGAGGQLASLKATIEV